MEEQAEKVVETTEEFAEATEQVAEAAAAVETIEAEIEVEAPAPKKMFTAFANDGRELPVLKKEKKDGEATAAHIDEFRWFSLRVISGKERKILERILKDIELNAWESFVRQVVVPVEKVFKMRNGKKVSLERNILPGYIMIEAIGAKLNGDVAKEIASIQNVIHFLGKEKPTPMSVVDANRLLGKFEEAQEGVEKMMEPFIIGEAVTITDGPFSGFVGDVQDVSEEKKKLKVIVKIFGRGTEVELSFLQVEKLV